MRKKNKKQPSYAKAKVIEPGAILERELAEEERDLRKVKVTEIFAGFRKDREKRSGELRTLMNDLKAQKIQRREAAQKFMRGLRLKVLDKKKMLPAVNL
mgnify:CR=1 FL=1